METTREDYKNNKLYLDYSNAKDIIDELFNIIEKQDREYNMRMLSIVNQEKHVKELEAKLAHYEDNVVARYIGNVYEDDFGDTRVLVPSHVKSGKKYKVIILKEI